MQQNRLTRWTSVLKKGSPTPAVAGIEENAMFWTSFSHTQQLGESFTKAMSESAARTEQWMKEMEKLEKQGFERTTQLLDESSKLAKETLAYAEKLGSEWRKLTLESMKKGPFGGSFAG
jgi:dipeptidase